MLGVERGLPFAAAPRLTDRARHRLRHDIGIHNHLAVDVARRAADGLDERRAAAQVPLLVGVEDPHERDLRQVQPLAQEIDADQDVEHAFAQVA